MLFHQAHGATHSSLFNMNTGAQNANTQETSASIRSTDAVHTVYCVCVMMSANIILEQRLWRNDILFQTNADSHNVCHLILYRTMMSLYHDVSIPWWDYSIQGYDYTMITLYYDDYRMMTMYYVLWWLYTRMWLLQYLYTTMLLYYVVTLYYCVSILWCYYTM